MAFSITYTEHPKNDLVSFISSSVLCASVFTNSKCYRSKYHVHRTLGTFLIFFLLCMVITFNFFNCFFLFNSIYYCGDFLLLNCWANNINKHLFAHSLTEQFFLVSLLRFKNRLKPLSILLRVTHKYDWFYFTIRIRGLQSNWFCGKSFDFLKTNFNSRKKIQDSRLP